MSTSRDTNLNNLHPLFKNKVIQLQNLLDSNNIPFKIFEGFRSPQRQNYLYQQGRTRPGNIITKAKPWTSYHQYGFAADFVLFINNTWSWDDKSTQNKKHWDKLHELGNVVDLEPLSWEKPHLQLKNISILKLKQGFYPDYSNINSNDYSTWAENLINHIINYSTNAPQPPKLIDLEKPPIPQDFINTINDEPELNNNIHFQELLTTTVDILQEYFKDKDVPLTIEKLSEINEKIKNLPKL